MDYLTPLQALVDDLNDTDGIAATLTRQTLNPPGVLVALDDLSDWTLGGTGTARVRLWAVARDLNELDAYTQLQPVITALAGFLADKGLPLTEDITADTVPSSDNAANLPAFRLTTTININ